MAKQVEKKKLERGKSYFQIVGAAKINQYTFKMENKSNSTGYVYNSLNLGVETKPGNIVYSTAMGGYNPTKSENAIYAADKDDLKIQMIVDFVDRFNPVFLDRIHDSKFIKVALETIEEKGTTRLFYKRFLSWYDAIPYIQEHLKDGMAVNVHGVLKYSTYKGNTQVKKEIQSITLSNAKPEEYFSKFVQTCVFDRKAVGAFDKETREVPLSVRVIDYMKDFIDSDGKVVKTIKKNFPYFHTLYTNTNGDQKKLEFLVKNYFNVKDITEITVEGEFLEGVAQSEPTEDDIPAQMLEMIELGLYTKEEAISTLAIKGDRVQKMVVNRPFFSQRKDKDNEDKIITEFFVYPKKYTDFDLDTSYVYEEDEVADEDLKTIVGGTSDLPFDDNDDAPSWLTNLDD